MADFQKISKCYRIKKCVQDEKRNKAHELTQKLIKNYDIETYFLLYIHHFGLLEFFFLNIMDREEGLKFVTYMLGERKNRLQMLKPFKSGKLFFDDGLAKYERSRYRPALLN